ncbi:MAG: hypothetical protein CBC09_03315 [Cellvibrionales bacterium TMED49]|nr:hypothetical protein [Porticoccaceae bacterium]OUU39151.1 MAG: hypothetical protein CBC09_03315 [Cellvibrionales bacterium TMED49]|tara:strand:- start:636 stop:1415 length:780 start_codon:yes stop_codon:yes gene_type:complete
MKQISIKPFISAVALVATLVSPLCVATEVGDILEVGAAKVEEARVAQVRVDRIADQTDGLLQEFKQVNKQIESLRVYNSQLERQVSSQKKMMSELEESIANATVIERGITPLMISMLESLEDFIALDMPFKREQRLGAIEELSVNLDSARYSAAEKFRQILEVYDIESDYSQSLETYRAMIDINANGTEVEVDVLRIGRVALAYQTKDKSQTGAWNKGSGSWQTLGSEYRRPIDQGIRIAKKLSPQDVIEMPITAPETL